MKKVVCGSCGFVNLESFPAFPDCEGCGERLPRRKKRLPRLNKDSWLRGVQRSAQVVVWGACLCVSIVVLGVLSLGIARETRLRDRGPLVVTSTLRQDTTTPQSRILTMRVASSDGSDQEPIDNLHLRFSDSDAKSSNVQIVSPQPSSVQVQGKGRYFVWDQFAPRQSLVVRLRPQGPLSMDLNANGFVGFRLYLSPIPHSDLPPQADLSSPLDLSSNRSN